VAFYFRSILYYFQTSTLL